MLVQSQLHSHLGQERSLNPKDKEINFALKPKILDSFLRSLIETLMNLMNYNWNQRYFKKR